MSNSGLHIEKLSSSGPTKAKLQLSWKIHNYATVSNAKFLLFSVNCVHRNANVPRDVQFPEHCPGLSDQSR